MGRTDPGGEGSECAAEAVEVGTAMVERAWLCSAVYLARRSKCEFLKE